VDLEATARRVLDDVGWRRYVALGDSTTEGLGDPVDGVPEGGWCEMVAVALRTLQPELQFFNLGHRYLTTEQIRARQLKRALELEPDLVTVVVGGNDMLVEHFDPRVTEEHFEAMVNALTDAGATVVTSSVPAC
jgi:lysophospholipase L1-like esterase